MSETLDPELKKRLDLIWAAIAFGLIGFFFAFALSQAQIRDSDIMKAEAVNLEEGFAMQVCGINALFGSPGQIVLCLTDTSGTKRSGLPESLKNKIWFGQEISWKNSFDEPRSQKIKFDVQNVEYSEKPPLEVKVYYYPSHITSRDYPPDNTFAVGFGNDKASVTYGSTWLGLFYRLAAALFVGFLFAGIGYGWKFYLIERERAGKDNPKVTVVEEKDEEKEPVKKQAMSEQQNLESPGGSVNEWNPAAIARQLEIVQNNPQVLTKLVESIKLRFVLNQDAKTQEARRKWLETQLAQLKLANEMADAAIAAQLKNKDFQEKSLKKDREIQKVTKEIEDEADRTIRELEKEDKRLERELSIARKKAELRKLAEPSAKPQPALSREDKLRLEKSKLVDDIKRIRADKETAMREAPDEDEKMRIGNFYDDLLDQKMKKLIELEGQL